MPGPVSTWMGDRLRTGEPSRYVTSHPGQLSLAIPLWVGAVGTSEGWGVNRHTARYTSPVSVVSQCKLNGWLKAKETEISAALWALVAWEVLYFLLFLWWQIAGWPLGCKTWMSGNLIAVKEVSRNWSKVGEYWKFPRKSCQGKLFIVYFMFGATPVF